MNTKRSFLSRYFHSAISSRTAVFNFFQDKISPSKKTKLILDFKGIDFISRAAADQIVKEVKTREGKFLSIRFANVNEKLTSLLTSEEKTRNVKNDELKDQLSYGMVALGVAAIIYFSSESSELNS